MKLSRIAAAVLSLLLALCLCVTAGAAGTVSYDGDADSFIFMPGSEESPTNLFGDLRNVMPGDSVTEQILIKNDSAKRVKIRVYMRSLGAQENTDDFLAQMNLTVAQNGDSVLFSAPANETAQLTEWVYLGTVYSGGEILLDVTLNVPITMGNEYQNRIGLLDWQFMIEELPVEPSDPRPPQTGDESRLWLYACVFAAASCLAAVFLLLSKKRKNN